MIENYKQEGDAKQCYGGGDFGVYAKRYSREGLTLVISRPDVSNNFVRVAHVKPFFFKKKTVY